MLGKFGPVRVILIIAFALVALYSYNYFTLQTIHTLLLQLQSDPYGTIHFYIIFHILSVVLLFPSMFMQIASGAVYGLFFGFVVSWASTTIGQTLAFLFGRYLFRKTVLGFLLDRVPNFAAIEAAIKREGWKVVALLRLSPILPYNVLNYILGLTSIGSWSYTSASALTIIPWTCVYVYLGSLSSNLLDIAKGQYSPDFGFQSLTSIIWVMLLLFTSIYGYVLSKQAIKEVLKEAQQPVLGEITVVRQVKIEITGRDIERS